MATITLSKANYTAIINQMLRVEGELQSFKEQLVTILSANYTPPPQANLQAQQMANQMANQQLVVNGGGPGKMHHGKHSGGMKSVGGGHGMLMKSDGGGYGKMKSVGGGYGKCMSHSGGGYGMLMKSVGGGYGMCMSHSGKKKTAKKPVMYM